MATLSAPEPSALHFDRSAGRVASGGRGREVEEAAAIPRVDSPTSALLMTRCLQTR